MPESLNDGVNKWNPPNNYPHINLPEDYWILQQAAKGGSYEAQETLREVRECFASFPDDLLPAPPEVAIAGQKAFEEDERQERGDTGESGGSSSSAFDHIKEQAMSLNFHVGEDQAMDPEMARSIVNEYRRNTGGRR